MAGRTYHRYNIPLGDEYDPEAVLGPKPPERIKNGDYNPAHYIWLIKELTLANDRHKIENGGKPMPDYGTQLKALKEQAQAAGFDPKGILDTRTEEEKTRSVITRLLEAPDSLFEMPDKMIEKLEQAMKEIAEGVHAAFERHVDGGKSDFFAARAQVWLERIRRLKRLRDLAANPVPKFHKCRKKHYAREEYEYEAAHPLRFMAYVGRSSLNQKDDVFFFPAHVARIASTIWIAENGVRVVPRNPDNPEGEFRPKEIPWRGCHIVIPPGHFKTETCLYWLALRIAQNPEDAAVVLHSKSDEANKRLGFVRDLFREQTANGRRLLSLFPKLAIDKRRSNNESKFNLARKHARREATLEAHGVSESAQGQGYARALFDDIVSQAEAWQEATRKRTYELVTGTWFRRIRGERGFFVVIGTLWHYDDANSRLRQMALSPRGGQGLLMVCQIEACGGPDNNFEPLDERIITRQKLRQEYALNRLDYSATYMSRPISDSQRVVTKIHAYDKEADSHKNFLKEAEFVFSVDPSATKGKKSDKAGLVYAAFGPVVYKTADARTNIKNEVRILNAWEIPANQADLVDYIKDFCSEHRTDVILVETRAGFHATADFLDRMYGLGAGLVHRMDPTIRDKVSRLREVAVLLQTGTCRFPGNTEKGKSGVIYIDDEIEWLGKEVLDFGVTPHDHALDALTQILRYYGPRLGLGVGEVTGKLRNQEWHYRNTYRDKITYRYMKLLEEQRNPSDDTQSDENDWVYARFGGTEKRSYAWN